MGREHPVSLVEHLLAALVQAQGDRGRQWWKPKGSDPHKVLQNLERDIKVYLSSV